MTAMTFDEWRDAERQDSGAAPSYERYRAYLAGVAFIRSQIGGLPMSLTAATGQTADPMRQTRR